MQRTQRQRYQCNHAFKKKQNATFIFLALGALIRLRAYREFILDSSLPNFSMPTSTPCVRAYSGIQGVTKKGAGLSRRSPRAMATYSFSYSHCLLTCELPTAALTANLYVLLETVFEFFKKSNVAFFISISACTKIKTHLSARKTMATRSFESFEFPAPLQSCVREKFTPKWRLFELNWWFCAHDETWLDAHQGLTSCTPERPARGIRRPLTVRLGVRESAIRAVSRGRSDLNS